MKKFFLILCFVATGCAQAAKQPSSTQKQTPDQRVKLVQNALNSRQAQKDRELILSKQGKSFQSDSLAFKAVPQRKKLELSGAHQPGSYASGMRKMAAGEYGDALLQFNRTIANSKDSQEGRLALYQKAVLYHKMNLPELSKQTLARLVKQYPDTLEGKRALVSLKTME